MKLSNNIKKIFKLFQKSNKQIYLVGGCVRDVIMGNIPHDFDFTTDAVPDEMKKIAASVGIEVIPTGEKYGTLTFHIDNEFYEITTFRIDGNYSSGRRPDKVVFSKKLEDDLCRRDFTFNAMCLAYDEESNKGKLIDLYKGRDDIKNKIINTIGKADDRFTEDALRMLRAVRFAYKLDFKLSEDVRKSIRKLYRTICNVSAERVREELFQIFSYCKGWDENRGPVLECLLREILKTPLQLSSLNIYTNPLLMLENLNIYKGDAPKDRGIDKLLKLSCVQSKRLDLVTRCFRLFESSPREGVKITLKKCLDICNKDVNVVQDVITLVTDQLGYFLFDYEILQDCLEDILKNNEPITIADLAINGDDLLVKGQEGKQIGIILNKCKEHVWKFPEENNREDLLKLSDCMI